VASDDVARVRAHYAERGARYAERFADDRPEVRYAWSRLTVRIQAALDGAGLDLASARVLDVGCGGGGLMAWLLERGVQPARLLGVDLVVPRLHQARRHAPAAGLALADGARLPLRDGRLDVVLALTSLSSMPSLAMRRDAAAQMLRVLRPGGVALCYEFVHKNPLNKYTVTLRPRQLAALFEGARVEIHRMSLHPWLVRALWPFGPRVLDAVEGIGALRSHLLAVVKKPTPR